MNETASSRTTANATAYHALAIDGVLQSLNTDAERGLDDAEVRRRHVKHGYNELARALPVPLWRKFLGHFNELVIWILIAAAVIAGTMGEWVDAVAIIAIVLINAVLGFFQEERAERALAALQKLSSPMAKVFRGCVLQTVPSRDLVPGDRIELEAGDNIPADARLLRAFGFRVQEAALTGESVPVDKDAARTFPASTPLGDRANMVYMGTVVTAGEASAVVVATGIATELGHIAELLGSEKPEPTPLQRRLAEIGRTLVLGCLVIVAVIFVLQWLRGGNLVESFLLSVSLAVAAVPEGLPAVVTVVLALGVQRMVKRHALVRKLPSVETLGSVTVICTDKTGTLTRNEMTVREIVVGGETFHVTGSGYAPIGQIQRRNADGNDPVSVNDYPDLIRSLTIAARCNHARVHFPKNGNKKPEIIGDPTEAALLVAARKGGINAALDERQELFARPFDSERKMMSVVFPDADGKAVMYAKGAPEVIIDRCTFQQLGGSVVALDEEQRHRIMRLHTEMASRALRVLALAFRAHELTDENEYPETDLVFAGLVGMIDPPREEARKAVNKCHDAAITPVMITGDHPATALAIAWELRLATEQDRVMTGDDLSGLSDEELMQQVGQIRVYARVSAEHKLRVVRAWKARGHVVAMTGDGVNDAPAIKAADIGIAMGVTGADVTKEAADLVLTDDNFASIVNAVEEGRGIFDNIQKFLHYLLSSNASEVLFMFFAALVGWPAPLLAVQILWINLVTDSLPALALGVEPPERDIMRRRPRPPHEPVITRRRGLRMLMHGALIATVTGIGFGVAYQGEDAKLPYARSVAFCVLAFAQLFFSFACRSQRRTMPELGLFSNPYLLGAIAVSTLLQLAVVVIPFAQPIFGTMPMSSSDWWLIGGLALTPVTIIEVAKILRALRTVRANDPV